MGFEVIVTVAFVMVNCGFTFLVFRLAKIEQRLFELRDNVVQWQGAEARRLFEAECVPGACNGHKPVELFARGERPEGAD